LNSIFANIYARRAVREYLPDDIPDETIKELIKAGVYAPSALNEQPWRFVVIKDRGLMKKCSDRAKKLWQESIKELMSEENRELIELASDTGFNIFYDAPVLVLIFSRPGADSPEFGCALAAENMMLAARSLNIGSCWIGMASVLGSDKELMREIGVPEDHRLMSQLIFGYPATWDIEIPERNMDVVLKWIKG
jgi:nitroreductase